MDLWLELGLPMFVVSGWLLALVTLCIGFWPDHW